MNSSAGMQLRPPAPKERTASPKGRIITFYSYKGGTGRSMALANVAWMLALNGQRVLVIDWDLEAPGIHRYFHPFLEDKELLSTEGLLDYVENLAAHSATSSESAADEAVDLIEYIQPLEWPRNAGVEISWKRFPHAVESICSRPAARDPRTRASWPSSTGSISTNVWEAGGFSMRPKRRCGACMTTF